MNEFSHCVLLPFVMEYFHEIVMYSAAFISFILEWFCVSFAKQFHNLKQKVMTTTYTLFILQFKSSMEMLMSSSKLNN